MSPNDSGFMQLSNSLYEDIEDEDSDAPQTTLKSLSAWGFRIQILQKAKALIYIAMSKTDSP